MFDKVLNTTLVAALKINSTMFHILHLSIEKDNRFQKHFIKPSPFTEKLSKNSELFNWNENFQITKFRNVEPESEVVFLNFQDEVAFTVNQEKFTMPKRWLNFF